MPLDRKKYLSDYAKTWRVNNREKHRENGRRYRENNREKYNAYMRRWHAGARAANPQEMKARVRRYRLKRKYRITPDEYDGLLRAQGGHCALCDRRPEQERSGHLNIDHCHATMRVRGLLCTVHNSAIAAFGDDAAGLMRALNYLIFRPGQTPPGAT